MSLERRRNLYHRLYQVHPDDFKPARPFEHISHPHQLAKFIERAMSDKDIRNVEDHVNSLPVHGGSIRSGGGMHSGGSIRSGGGMYSGGSMPSGGAISLNAVSKGGPLPHQFPMGAPDQAPNYSKSDTQSGQVGAQGNQVLETIKSSTDLTGSDYIYDNHMNNWTDLAPMVNPEMEGPVEMGGTYGGGQEYNVEAFTGMSGSDTPIVSSGFANDRSIRVIGNDDNTNSTMGMLTNYNYDNTRFFDEYMPFPPRTAPASGHEQSILQPNVDSKVLGNRSFQHTSGFAPSHYILGQGPGSNRDFRNNPRARGAGLSSGGNIFHDAGKVARMVYDKGEDAYKDAKRGFKGGNWVTPPSQKMKPTPPPQDWRNFDAKSLPGPYREAFEKARQNVDKLNIKDQSDPNQQSEDGFIKPETKPGHWITPITGPDIYVPGQMKINGKWVSMKHENPTQYKKKLLTRGDNNNSGGELHNQPTEDPDIKKAWDRINEDARNRSGHRGNLLYDESLKQSMHPYKKTLANEISYQIRGFEPSHMWGDVVHHAGVNKGLRDKEENYEHIPLLKKIPNTPAGQHVLSILNLIRSGSRLPWEKKGLSIARHLLF